MASRLLRTATRTITRILARPAEWSVRVATLGVLVQALRQRNPNGVVNAVAMVPATYLPDVVEHLFEVEFEPWQRVYTEVAMLAHAVGFLGPYEDTWWWDHLTHVLSASLLGGVVHVVARRRGRDPDLDVIAAIVGGGLLWEVGEYVVHRVSDRLGVEPMLVVYGPRDTAWDLVFNLVGALVVIVFGDDLLENFTRKSDRD